MVFSDGKHKWVLRPGLSRKRMFRAEPVDVESFRRRATRLAAR
jgi:hypothetical protein